MSSNRFHRPIEAPGRTYQQNDFIGRTDTRPIAVLARCQPGWTWRPDSVIDEIEAFLWAHKWVDSWIGYGIAFAAGFALGWCLT